MSVSNKAILFAFASLLILTVLIVAKTHAGNFTLTVVTKKQYSSFAVCQAAADVADNYPGVSAHCE